MVLELVWHIRQPIAAWRCNK